MAQKNPGNTNSQRRTIGETVKEEEMGRGHHID